jgi:hypothetical protein
MKRSLSSHDSISNPKKKSPLKSEPGTSRDLNNNNIKALNNESLAHLKSTISKTLGCNFI